MDMTSFSPAVASAVLAAAAGLAAPAVAAAPLPSPVDRADARRPDSAPAPPAPSAPTSIPSGAVLPPPYVPTGARFAQRLHALERALECRHCDGRGERVRTVRGPSPHLAGPAPLFEVRSACDRCGGSGMVADAERIRPRLDALVAQFGAFAPAAGTPPRQLERCHGALRRIAAAPGLAERLGSRDRADLAAGRAPAAGSVVAVLGEVRRPIPRPGGERLIPVSVGPGVAVILRGMAVNEVPERGRALVGGVAAGTVSGVEWEWGRVPVLDAAFVVPAPAPARPPPRAGPA